MFQGIGRDRDFLKLWFGETISDFGDQITLLAIPLTAVIVLKASAFEMGILAAVATLPTALFSLVVGVWVDRVRRRRVLIAADIGRALVLATVPIAFVIGVLSLPQLFVVAFVSGTLSVFFVVAYQAYLPALVGREHLVDANGKMNASASLAQLAGPSAAGILVQLFTAPMPVVVDALSFVGSVVGLSLIRRPEPVLAPVSVAVAQLIGLVGFSIVNVSSPSLRQALRPPHLLGRVNASYRFLVWGTGPFGALLGGTLGELFGLRAALLITGIASLAIR